MEMLTICTVYSMLTESPLCSNILFWWCSLTWWAELSDRDVTVQFLVSLFSAAAELLVQTWSLAGQRKVLMVHARIDNDSSKMSFISEKEGYSQTLLVMVYPSQKNIILLSKWNALAEKGKNEWACLDLASAHLDYNHWKTEML